MIYRSNLTAPDLQPAFKHVHCRPMGHSMGHEVLSDFADRPVGDPLLGLYKNCGFWTHSEAAILYTVASMLPGTWVDIGCHTMWTSAHIAAAGPNRVLAIDPMLRVKEFAARAHENLQALGEPINLRIEAIDSTSNEAFADHLFQLAAHEVAGVVIDGDHCHPCPMQDAENAYHCLDETGFILFHDFIGRPVRAGVQYLLDRGFKCRVYWTPHMVACCWRGDLQPPDYIRDPLIDWGSVQRSMPDFDFEACA